jgi:3',5'-cyclic AMP phosphodiesterase CpdA
MFRLAHVSDPHFRGLAGLGPGALVSKQLVGLLNLALVRVRKHKMGLLERLRLDLRAQAPDHLALTGDFANVSLEGEWRAALAWIDLAGLPAEAITVIPGNHDAYIPSVVKARTFERLFAPYMTNDLAGEAGGADYPFVHLRDEVALVGVTSAVATRDLGAWGEIGTAQLERLEAVLAAPELRGRTRLVLVHHPPVRQKGDEQRNLRDRAALAAVLARVGAELVLHGHDHKDERAHLPGPGGKDIPVIGAGSASYAGASGGRARWNLYEIEGGRITWTTRAHDEAADAFREVRREVL